MDRPIDRRMVLAAGLGWPLAATASGTEADLLRSGSLVAAFRHALAPGTFDPPGFQLGDCSTQRNLSDEGRDQARRIGVWFSSRGLKPARVRSSPWCRCIDTAQLAFGRAEPWAPLGSPRAGTESTNAQSLAALRQALMEATRNTSGFEVWVTHMFVLADLTGSNTASGEGLLLRADRQGSAVVIGRIVAP
jgi:hypothetical protein